MLSTPPAPHPGAMDTPSSGALTLSHGTSGVWEGTFQVLLSALLTDILSDGPYPIRLRLNHGGYTSGTLIRFDDDYVELDSSGGGIRIDRDNILALTLI